jgi:molybdopterin/thiamine biosynthesis adenylyltransferase
MIHARPMVKKIYRPFRISDRLIRLGGFQYGIGSEIEDDEQGTVWQLLGLMDGTRTASEIVDQMLQTRPNLDRDSVGPAMEAIIEHGFVEDSGAAIPPELSQREVDRYKRNTAYFSWIDTAPRATPYDHQARLKKSRVTVLGLGGSGSSVAVGLAAAGVGSILCADFDTVEESNLNRQILYTEDDIGKNKVDAAVARLRKLNSCIDVTGLQVQVREPADLLPLMENRDLLLMCADKPADSIQRIVNQAALRTNTPWIISAYAGPMVVVGTHVPHVTPCVECMIRHMDAEKEKMGVIPRQFLFGMPDLQAVISPTAALTGSLAALEAIYYLTGLNPQTLGRVFHQNLIAYDQSFYLTWPLWEECPTCGPHRPKA